MYNHANPDETEDNIEVSTENEFLCFWKKFRVTMRSLVFLQYFTVAELIRLKLVHSQLNHIINQEWIEVAILIGNFTELERKLYWNSFTNYTIEMIYRLCPSSMIDLIKNSRNSTLFIFKSSLKSILPPKMKDKDVYIVKIIAQLMIHQHLYRIFMSSILQGTKVYIGIDMMVFALESLISKYWGVSLKDNKKILYQCFSNILMNIGSNKHDILICLLEWFSVGGWPRIYK